MPCKGGAHPLPTPASPPRAAVAGRYDRSLASCSDRYKMTHTRSSGAVRTKRMGMGAAMVHLLPLLLLSTASALDNGVGRLPAMGWSRCEPERVRAQAVG